MYTSDQGIFAQNFWLKIHFLYTSDHDYSDLFVRNAVGRKVSNPSITVYIYAFLSHDSYRVREIKYLKFGPKVDVHFCLTPLPPMSACVCFCLTLSTPFMRTSFMDDPLHISYLRFFSSSFFHRTSFFTIPSINLLQPPLLHSLSLSLSLSLSFSHSFLLLSLSFSFSVFLLHSFFLSRSLLLAFTLFPIFSLTHILFPIVIMYNLIRLNRILTNSM